MPDPTIPDPHPVVPWLTPHRRAWLYRVVVTAVALLVVYGALSGEEAAAWVAAAAALIGSGTAALHTPRGDG